MQQRFSLTSIQGRQHMTKQCPECQTSLEAEQPRCTNCGLIQDSFVYKSRVAAAIMAFSFGLFGLHRFYLGKWWGILYLLFFWTYIPVLISWIEGIVFLCSDQKKWNKKYNQGLSAGSEKGTVLLIIFALVFTS